MDDGYAARSAICSRFSFDLGEDLTDGVKEVLLKIVHAPAAEALDLADELARGCVNGLELFEQGKLDDQTILLLADLASGSKTKNAKLVGPVMSRYRPVG
jgi:hypothetical protein